MFADKFFGRFLLKSMAVNRQIIQTLSYNYLRSFVWKMENFEKLSFQLFEIVILIITLIFYDLKIVIYLVFISSIHLIFDILMTEFKSSMNGCARGTLMWPRSLISSDMHRHQVLHIVHKSIRCIFYINYTKLVTYYIIDRVLHCFLNLF